MFESTYFGELHIDHTKGIITFKSLGDVMLRITHLAIPIPAEMKIDIVALEHLTSITPIIQE